MSIGYSSPPPFPSQSAASRTVAWIVILLVIGYVFWGANFSPAGRRSMMKSSGRRSEDVQFTISARLTVGNKGFQESLTGQSITPQNARIAMQSLDNAAHTSRQRLEAAIVAGELSGNDEALRRLRALRERKIPSLNRDIQLLTRVYSDTSAVNGLKPEERARLKRRFGWFGDLALVHELPDSDPAHQRVIAPANRAMKAIMIGFAGICVIGFVGFVLLIIAIALSTSGKLRWHYSPVAPAGVAAPAIYLETFALYIVLFVGLGELISRIAPHMHLPKIYWYVLLCSALPIAMAWPAWRGGRRWRDLLYDLGWHRGATRSAFAEMFLGIAGYIACLPIIAVGFVITLTITKLTHIDASHPIIDQLTGSRWQLFGIFLLACVWAPISEETMFRGALYNHLRGRARWWGSWIISSMIVGVLFAAVHPQGWTAIPLLGSIGMSLAWIREWRGSLIGSMTAHALNNGVALMLAISLLR